MAKIKTYANDNTINANDRLIGTDFNDSDKTKNYLISALKNYILNGLDTRPYKVYTALLSQTGTNAPIATVLENTLGVDVVWIKDHSGYFLTEIPFVNQENTSVIVGKQFASGASDGIMSYTDVNRGVVALIVVDNFDSGTTVDGELNNTPIEIRVYN
jgi:hypothetical protein